MQTPLLFSLLLFLLLAIDDGDASPKHDLVRQSCVHAPSPAVCLRTLRPYRSTAGTPWDLARAAVNVSMAHVRKTTEFLTKAKGSGQRERGALNDCVEEMADAVDELSKTMSALQELRRGGDFWWEMSNARTWMSAAITYEDTCLDGLEEIGGKVRSDVRKKVTNVGRVTSNALYLINLLHE